MDEQAPRDVPEAGQFEDVGRLVTRAYGQNIGHSLRQSEATITQRIEAELATIEARKAELEALLKSLNQQPQVQSLLDNLRRAGF